MLTTLVRADNKVAPEAIEKLLPPHVGAAVLVTDGGEVVFERCWGLRCVDDPAPVTPTTTFRMASVSKQFTATAVLTLVDRGAVALDDPLSKFFRDAPDYWSQITVHHLLTHTSGLPAYEGLIPKGTTLQVTDYNVLAMLLATEAPRFEPGSQWEYSNSGYALLALIVEQAGGKPYHEHLRSEVLAPLGMTGSVNYLLGMNAPPDRAYGHERADDGSWEVADQSVTSAVRGDGSVYSSLRDMQKWAAELGHGGVLSEASARAMTSPQFKTTRDDAHYGYGLFIDEHRGERRVWHSGSTRGFSLMLQRYPDRDATVVILLNRSAPAEKIADKVVDRLLFAEQGAGETQANK